MTRGVTFSLVVFALVLTACGAGPAPSPPGTDGAPSPTEAAATPEPAEPTEEGRLALVQDRGLICGVNGSLPGFSFLDEDGEMVGFDADFCRAVAAAVTGDAENVEFRPTTADQRGPALQTGEYDVLIRNTTWTVSRDTSLGLFGLMTLYDGQAIIVNWT